ncbi:hypothetical protein [Wenyingzhuangia sp. IMCC45574]
MENDIRENKVREILEKICLDSQFSKSSRYTQLLRFLTEQSLEGNHLKEQTIGNALFEKGYNPIKDDGKVRVYMFNLRKKLTAYYEGEGANDEIVFLLEKGSYDIVFIDKDNIDEKNKLQEVPNDVAVTKHHSLKTYQFSTIGLVISLIALLFISNYKTIFPSETYCWNDFFEKGTVNTFVLADHVVMHHPNHPRGNLYMRDGVNSSADYITYKKKHQDSLTLADYTLFTKGVPFSVMDLSRLFVKHNANMIPKPESEFTYDAINRGNVVYMGQQKVMSLSKEIFLKNSKKFSSKLNAFIVTENDKKTVYRSKHGDNKLIEYAMVSYFPLNNGNKAMYFVSDHDIGVMATVELFTNLEKLAIFYKKLPANDVYFNALFKVKGLNRLDVSCELVELEVIKD